MDLKAGDTVVIHKPYDTEQPPYWVDGMDKFDGMETVITEVLKGIRWVHLKGCEGVWFLTDWVDFVEEDEEIIPSDISTII